MVPILVMGLQLSGIAWQCQVMFFCRMIVAQNVLLPTLHWKKNFFTYTLFKEMYGEIFPKEVIQNVEHTKCIKIIFIMLLINGKHQKVC
jgi:hypothetical protein